LKRGRGKKCQLINQKVGKCYSSDKTGIVTNPQKVAEMLNAYFVETLEEIIKQSNYPSNTHTAQAKIDYCPNSIFVLPITENETVLVIKKFKGKFSAGYGEIPQYEYVV
jgi:hypothetical protein